MRFWPISVVLWLAAGPAGAHPAPWREVAQRTFSAAARANLALSYTSAEQSDVIRSEIQTCLSADPKQCIDLVLQGYYLLDKDQVEKVLELAVELLPVDPIVVAGERRPIPGSTPAAVKRRSEVAAASSFIWGDKDVRTRRRRVEAAVAAWRAGEDLPADVLLATELDKSVPLLDPLLALAESFRVAASLDSMWGKVPSSDDMKRANEVYRRNGNLSASNLAAVLLAKGESETARPLSIDGHAALAAKLGTRDPRTIAAAMVVVDAHVVADPDVARPFAELVARARQDDAAATPREKVEILRAQANLHTGDAGLAFVEQAIALIRANPSAIPARLQSTVLTDAAMRSLAKGNLRATFDHARDARLADPDARQAATLQAFAALMLPNLPPELKSGADDPGNLLHTGWNPRLGPEHPERLLNALVWSFYYMNWNARYAPYYARRGTEGAVQRLNQRNTFDAAAAAELEQMRALFVIQVQASWKASTL